ncbi:MAG TPA: serine protease, partial [Bacteroidaceae bacterium]|nr:serine protease [Bacteroidaceae bacterium]
MNIADKGLLIFLILILGFAPVRSEEGMWIPLLLEKYNIEDMQEKGCRLSAEQIYSINQDCLADAVVIFGRGCTGEVISAEGLVLTNHHCGFSAIQSLSSLDNNFITNGYWAMSREEELPGQDLTVTFLRYIEDVTEKIMEGIDHSMDDEQKELIIQKNMHQLTADGSGGNGSRTIIKSFYYGNEYYLFVYDVFRDIRLVGAPPNSIGNFGSDQDNWMWPRHTGDFSLFRIYADKDNMPADYSPDNIPYKPRKHFEISLNGVHEGDFTMVLGYPGSTEQFLYS